LHQITRHFTMTLGVPARVQPSCRPRGGATAHTLVPGSPARGARRRQGRHLFLSDCRKHCVGPLTSSPLIVATAAPSLRPHQPPRPASRAASPPRPGARWSVPADAARLHAPVARRWRAACGRTAAGRLGAACARLRGGRPSFGLLAVRFFSVALLAHSLQQALSASPLYQGTQHSISRTHLSQICGARADAGAGAGALPSRRDPGARQYPASSLQSRCPPRRAARGARTPPSRPPPPKPHALARCLRGRRACRVPLVWRGQGV
jgi:hypothetical protein